ncbi:MAG: CPBP family intramembrane metalloprotease [Proteobacteria bacterium]|nr:CPBP family intramembrane metalloprotease [Pseudomonadota bacterium]
MQSIRAPIAAILLIQAFVLVVRELIGTRLRERGIETDFAKDLSYLVVPLLLAGTLYPVLKVHKAYLLELFSVRRLTMRLVLTAIAIGVLARVVYWCQLLGSIAFGLLTNSDPAAIPGPLVSFGCPPAHVFLLGLLVAIGLVPVIEEIINRGLIQATLMNRGRWFAIIVSALLFAAFHTPASMPFVFIFGIVFAMQFANTRTLWTTIITHATYDGLIQFDWRCVQGNWNPPIGDTPMLGLGVTYLLGLIVSCAAIAGLLTRAGVPKTPRTQS